MVDMETGAIVAVTLYGADEGETATVQGTVAKPVTASHPLLPIPRATRLSPTRAITFG